MSDYIFKRSSPLTKAQVAFPLIRDRREGHERWGPDLRQDNRAVTAAGMVPAFIFEFIM